MQGTPCPPCLPGGLRLVRALKRGQLFHGYVAVDDVVGRIRPYARGRWPLIAYGADLPWATPREKAALEALAHRGYGALKPYLRRYGIRVRYRRR